MPSAWRAAMPSGWRAAAAAPARRAASSAPAAGDGFEPRTAILMQLDDRSGALHEVLKYFWKHDVNLTRIESRPTASDGTFEFFVDFEGRPGEPHVEKLLATLSATTRRMLVVDAGAERSVPWFPRAAGDLDAVANRVLDAGTDLEADHPGFSDGQYRARRAELAALALAHRHGATIPEIAYTADETATWCAVYARLKGLQAEFACREYREILPRLEAACGGAWAARVPQQHEISSFLERTTGFRLRPVAGLLSSRDFLNGLAFRVFFSTQYIRHHSKPLYTPEPDICHELLGHAPMFADADFADFSQQIGLASLGASDDDVAKLAACYWHSVEFGLCREDSGAVKAYGAGLLSSFGELEYACAPYRPAGGTEQRPALRDWEPDVACVTSFPITEYQPTYFVARSLADAKERMREYCETRVRRPFHARYNPATETIWVDRAIAPSALPAEEAQAAY